MQLLIVLPIGNYGTVFSANAATNRFISFAPEFWTFASDGSSLPMKQTPSLLVFEPRRLGDSILSLPLVRSALPSHQVYVCCQPASRPIFERLLPPENVFDSIVPQAGGRWLGWLSNSFRQLRKRLNILDLDAIVSVWPDPRVLLWMNLISARTRVGFLMSKQNYYAWERPERGRRLWMGQCLQTLLSWGVGRPLLTQSLVRNRRDQSHLQGWEQIAGALELKWELATPWFPVSSLSPNHPVADFVHRAQSAGRRVWLLHAGAGSPVREWGPAKFHELIGAFSNSDREALIALSGPGEPMLNTRPTWQISHRTASLAELFGITTLVDRVLCQDSMMSHLAAALGVPVHALFGPTSVDWFAPFNNRSGVIRRGTCPHLPCMDRCRYASALCMDAISVQFVIDAIQLEQDGNTHNFLALGSTQRAGASGNKTATNGDSRVRSDQFPK